MKKKNLLAIFALFATTSTTLFGFKSIDNNLIRNKRFNLNEIENLQFHLDAQALTLENNSKVNYIKNLENNPTLKGVGDAKQSDLSRQPTFIKESSLNGLAAIRMDRNSFLQIGSDEGFYLNDNTIFIVGNIDTNYDSDHAELLSRTANKDPWCHNWFNNIEGGKWNYGWSTNSDGQINHPKATVNIPNKTTTILTTRKLKEKGSLIANGNELTSFIAGNPIDEGTYNVGLGGRNNNDSIIGDIGEVLIFDRGLSDLEISNVEKYLEEKWNMEGIHDSELTDLRIKNETITGFKSTRFNYYVLNKEDSIKKEDISYALFDDSNKVEILETSDGFKIIVKGKSKSSTYYISQGTLNYDYGDISSFNQEDVTLTDGYWSEIYNQFSTYSQIHVYDMFDKTKSFDNFDRIAKGEKYILKNTSEHAGEVLKFNNDKDVENSDTTWIEEPWREGLIYETIRATSQFLMNNRKKLEYKENNEEMFARVNDYVTRIYNASLKTTYKDANGKPVDGYFSTYNILKDTKVCDESSSSGRWHHDTYNFGCLTEAAITWYRATGDTRLLFIATRFAEFLIDYMYGRDGYQGYMLVPPHELSEEAMMNLYLLYKENPNLVKFIESKYSKVEGLDPSDRYYELEIRYDKYLDICHDWINKRGTIEGRFNNTSFGDYAQDNQHYTEIVEAQGHAVRANLWYANIAYIGNKTQNFSYIDAAYRIYEDIINHQQYITGGTGSTNDSNEAYGGDDVLNHDGYCETCASSGMTFFAQNMFEIFGDAKYADQVEEQLYNNLIGSINLTGNGWYYTNPLISNDYIRPNWSNVTPCCPPMFLKLFSQLTNLIYSKNSDNEVFINQFISSNLITKLNDKDFKLMQTSDMPNGNSLNIYVENEEKITLKVREPSWSKGFKAKVNNKEVTLNRGNDGYINVILEKGTNNLEFNFIKEVERIYQNNAIANQGQVALKYGPFIYCAESFDNKKIRNFKNIYVNKDAKISVLYNEDKFIRVMDKEGKAKRKHPVNLLEVEGKYNNKKKEKITLIPFYLRGNRMLENNKPGQMQVWFKE